MKKINLYYWISTGLLAALMTFSAIPDVASTPEAVEMITKHLGYPAYFLPYIGVAKLLGVIVLLVPGFSRLKEWAYAGFVFDIVSAMYSMKSVGDPFKNWILLVIVIALIFISYFFFHKRRKVLVRLGQ